ncbi:MAG: cytochrome c3 family protein [Neomegalonema sp.]|nr:cytochrome c3 family protein [Neomegalonema sp.]
MSGFFTTPRLWLIWILGTLVLAGFLLVKMYLAGDRTDLLIGQTSGVHHQFEVACETCHTADPFASPKKVSKELNKTCRGCHDAELDVSDDSHPRKKFTNPRMARFWEKVDARNCTSCHLEHQPEVTTVGMVSLPMDYCVACHSEGEQDVRVNRPSHKDLSFDTCASAGCHNFHDNRALYEDFLVKHGNDPWLHASPIHKASADAQARMRGQMEEYLAAAKAPPAQVTEPVLEHWAASAHAAAEVNCAGCHAPKAKTEEAIAADWEPKPSFDVCKTCHRDEFKSFTEGRHGMRLHAKIAKPRKIKDELKDLGWKKPDPEVVETLERYLSDATPPEAMSVSEARIPMQSSAHDKSLNCGSCHAPHEQDIRKAAVEACVSCHDDGHSKAYFDSPHYLLWQEEMAGTAPLGSGVSCATCHLPKIEGAKGFFSTHNQNAYLRPNEKMIRPVCMDCHGLGFAIDALADPGLVARNFKGRPEKHIESIDWALRRVEDGAQGANQ